MHLLAIWHEKWGFAKLVDIVGKYGGERGIRTPGSGPSLDLDTYPGLQITGIVGRTYRIESSPDMNTWSVEAEVVLETKTFLWIDENGLGKKEFYRAVLLP